MIHKTVYAEEGIYAGWPANHGAWQWGNEFLVGFIRGEHTLVGMHNVKGRLEKVLARSLDGGETWSVEIPNVDFEAKAVTAAPAFDLNKTIIRVCGGYDHGGEKCAKLGGFYLSCDRGKIWEGAFSFDGVAIPVNQHNTSRTCVLDQLVFLSAAVERHWGSDYTFCVMHDGKKFIPKSTVCFDNARAVMPAVARIGNRIVVALRRRGTRRPGGWIDAVYSDDEGATWSSPVHVAETGSDNGNPPSLIVSKGKLFCAYANRSSKTVEVMQSTDGVSWTAAAELRRGNASDIGYTRLFRRDDGKLVCVYYWTEEFEKAQRIEVTIFEPSGESSG